MNCIYACNRNSPHHSFSLSLSLLCRCSGSLRLLAEQSKRAEGHLSQSIHDCSFILWAMATPTAQTLTECGRGWGVRWRGSGRRGVTAVDSERESTFSYFYICLSLVSRAVFCAYTDHWAKRMRKKRARELRTLHTQLVFLSFFLSLSSILAPLFLLLCYCMWQFEHNEVMRATAAELRKIVISSNWSGAQSRSGSAWACYENWQWLALFVMLMTTATGISHVS